MSDIRSLCSNYDNINNELTEWKTKYSDHRRKRNISGNLIKFPLLKNLHDFIEPHPWDTTINHLNKNLDAWREADIEADIEKEKSNNASSSEIFSDLGRKKYLDLIDCKSSIALEILNSASNSSYDKCCDYFINKIKNKLKTIKTLVYKNKLSQRRKCIPVGSFNNSPF